MSLRVSELRVYPVKSFAGSKLDSATITPSGLPFDRHFVVATASGNFLTQRQYPRMALATARISPPQVASGAVPASALPSEACLVLSAPGQEDFRLLLCRSEPVPSEALRRVRVWGWEGLAVDQGDAVGAWVSDAIGVPNLRLLRFAAQRDWSDAELREAKEAVATQGEEGADGSEVPSGDSKGADGSEVPSGDSKGAAVAGAAASAKKGSASPASPLPPVPASLSSLVPRRGVDPLWSPPGTETAFSDEFPYLIATLASLESANEAVREATGGQGPRLDIRRFRPNVVVKGAKPWEEDHWERLRVGGAVFDVAKPCARCVMTTVDPDAGTRPREGPQAEPLKTLRALRSGKALGWAGRTPADFDDSVFFGWNAAAMPLERQGDNDQDANANETDAATGTVRVGDLVHVLRRRGGAPLEGAAADREWRADAAKRAPACAFASGCANGECPIAAGIQTIWNALARAVAASGLSPYALAAALVALACFFAGVAFAGGDAAATRS